MPKIFVLRELLLGIFVLGVLILPEVLMSKMLMSRMLVSKVLVFAIKIIDLDIRVSTGKIIVIFVFEINDNSIHTKMVLIK